MGIRRVICVFVIHIWLQHSSSWHGSCVNSVLLTSWNILMALSMYLFPSARASEPLSSCPPPHASQLSILKASFIRLIANLNCWKICKAVMKYVAILYSCIPDKVIYNFYSCRIFPIYTTSVKTKLEEKHALTLHKVYRRWHNVNIMMTSYCMTSTLYVKCSTSTLWLLTFVNSS